MIAPAMAASIELLQKYANAKFVGLSKVGNDKLENVEVTLRNSEIKRILGIEIPEEM